jgi:hypothetical protein
VRFGQAVGARAHLPGLGDFSDHLRGHHDGVEQLREKIEMAVLETAMQRA